MECEINEMKLKKDLLFSNEKYIEQSGIVSRRLIFCI
jgi:hypothetical protein